MATDQKWIQFSNVIIVSLISFWGLLVHIMQAYIVLFTVMKSADCINIINAADPDVGYVAHYIDLLNIR